MSSSRRASALVLAATLGASAVAPAARADTLPATPPVWGSSSARQAFVLGGALLFALPYIASAIAATTGYTTDDGTTSARGFLWIPAAGPFIQLGSKGSTAGDVFLVLDGLAQVGGITLFAYGLTLPKARAEPVAPTAVRLSVSPLLSPHASGAALLATF